MSRAIMRINKLAWIGAFLSLVLMGCQEPSNTQTESNSASANSPAVATVVTESKELTPNAIDGDFALTDLLMQRDRTVAFNANGDLRPFWIVEGRITNTSGWMITSVQLELTASDTSTSHELDTAFINIKRDIPPADTIAFRRDIQLMLPEKGWGWNCVITKATHE